MAVNHRQAIETLLRTVVQGEPARPVSAADRQAALDHVAQCSKCWETLAVLETKLSGSPPPDMEEMRALYDCDSVRNDLWQIADLSQEEITAQFPRMALHLDWCHSCLEDLREIRDVVAADAAEESGTTWLDTVAAAGQAVRELAGSLRVALADGVAAFTQVPPGVDLVALSAAPTKGSAKVEPSARHTDRRVQFRLADSPLTGELTTRLRPDGLELMLVVLPLTAGDGSAMSAGDRRALTVEVSEAPPKEGPAIVVDRVNGQVLDPFLFHLVDGEYRLAIHDEQSNTTYRIALTVSLAG